MKIKDLNTITNELDTQYKENDKLINLYDAKTKIIEINLNDNKLGNTMIISGLSYFLLTVGTFILNNTLGILTLINFVPPIIVPVIIVGTSLGIGIVGHKLVSKKYKHKEKLAQFSKAKTQTEKIEEQTTYEIEKNKLKNRNKVIKQIAKYLNNNVFLSLSLQGKNYVEEKNTSQTKVMIKQKLKELSTILETKNNDLDILCTKEVLSKKFVWDKDSFNRAFSTVMASSFGISVWLLLMPWFNFIKNSVVLSSTETSNLILSLFSIGALGAGGYWIKRTKDRVKAFKNLNKKLGINDLTNDYEKEDQLELEIKEKIKEIALLRIEYEIQNRTLQNIREQQRDNVREKLNGRKVSQIKTRGIVVSTSLQPKRKILGKRTLEGKYYHI